MDKELKEMLDRVIHLLSVIAIELGFALAFGVAATFYFIFR